MGHTTHDRREFLKLASMAAVAMPFLISCRGTAEAASSGVLAQIKKNANTSPSVNWCGAIDAPDNVSWKTELKPKSAGDQLILISGTVYRSDGKTPAPNVLIYFYHTDSQGFYGRGNGEPQHGHFRGWLLTGADGRYQFNSIKPDPYPQRRQSAHIHMTLTGTDFREESIDAILFEGDSFITDGERASAGREGGGKPIVTLQKQTSGVWTARRDIFLKG